MSTRIATALALAATLALPAAGEAQGSRRDLLPGSRVWVEGTSNKSDWSVQATELSGFVVLQLRQDELEVSSGSFTVPAKKIVSEQGVIMDRLMHGALKANEHPTIVYQLDSATVAAAAGGAFTLGTTGQVTIAGVSRPVREPVQAERLANGTLRFTGSHTVLMNEHGMTPPTAMFGTLRTGNRVVVHFELLVKP